MKTSNRNYLLLLCILFTSLVSCKKENTPGVASFPKIKTITQAANTFTYSYDDKGRVSKVVSSSLGTTEYHYSNDSIYVSTFNGAGQVISTEILKLNVDGLVTHQTNPPLNNIDQSYGFSAAKQLTKTHLTLSSAGQPDFGIDYNFFYSNNNNDSIRIIFSSGSTPTDTIDFHNEYFTDRINTIGNENSGLLHLGKSSQNLIRTSREVEAGIVTISNYSYSYDSQNRVTEQIETSGSNSTVRRFTYY